MAAGKRRTQMVRRQRTRTWFEHHAWSIKASLQRLAARPVGSMLTVLVMGFALALPVVFWMVLWNAQHTAGVIGQTPTVSVFLQVDLAGKDADRLADQVRQRPDVAEVRVHTPEQGLAELASMQGFTQALRTLDSNPLPYVLVVTPDADSGAAGVRTLAAALGQLSGVDQVQDSGVWQQRLQYLLAVGRRTALLLAVLLALAAVMVVGNGVRVDIENRTEEISVLKLVGASPAFIRRVYLYAGLWYGLGSGILACLLTLLVEWVLAGPVQRLVASYGGQLAFGGLPLGQLAWVPLLAAVLGWFGARAVSGYWLRRLP